MGAFNPPAAGGTITVNPVVGFTSPVFLAWFNSLPVVLPESSGVPWNNGGTLALS